MRIERIEVFAVRLPMKAVLTLPRGPSRTLAEGKRVALVKITDADGNVLWGEGSEPPLVRRDPRVLHQLDTRVPRAGAGRA